MVGLLMMNQDHAEAKVPKFEGLNLVEAPRQNKSRSRFDTSAI